MFPGGAIGENLPTRFPVFLRKTKASLWKDPAVGDQEIAEKFFCEGAANSYWEIHEPSQVGLAAHFIDSRSDNPRTNTCFLVAIPSEMVHDAAASCEQVDEACDCVQLQGRHYNIRVFPDAGRPLVQAARSGGFAKVTPHDMKFIHRELGAAGCRSVRRSDLPCVCTPEPT